MKYEVIDRRKDGTGDMFNDRFSNLGEANKAAESAWAHLTHREKAARVIEVVELLGEDEMGCPIYGATVAEMAEED